MANQEERQAASTARQRNAIETSHLAATPVQLDDTVLVKMANTVSNLGDLTQDAAAATAFEKKLTFFQAIRM